MRTSVPARLAILLIALSAAVSGCAKKQYIQPPVERPAPPEQAVDTSATDKRLPYSVDSPSEEVYPD